MHSHSNERYISTNLPKRTKKVCLAHQRDELLQDIRNIAYVEGDIMQTDNEHDKHQVMDICEDGNIERVTRILDLAHNECVEALFPFSKKAIREDFIGMENMYDERYTYGIRLLVPDDFSVTTATLLKNLINEYMVCRVLADWLSITKPSSVSTWQEKADNAMTKMREAVNFRVKRVRRTQTPF